MSSHLEILSSASTLGGRASARHDFRMSQRLLVQPYSISRVKTIEALLPGSRDTRAACCRQRFTWSFRMTSKSGAFSQGSS